MFINVTYKKMMLLCAGLLWLMGTIPAAAYDRKTAQQPFKHQLDHLENQFSTLESQLDMKNPSGPVIARLLASLRKLAETDGKVAEVLRSFSLL